MDVKKLTAPCGFGCFTCVAYKDNITPEFAETAAKQFGMKAEDVSCDGCRSEKGCSFEMPLSGGKGCKTKKCVDEKGIHNCSECSEMPCEHLMPVADAAERVPLNTKVYNLGRIRLLGLEGWAQEAGLIQQKYFKGKFTYGTCPTLGEEK